MTTEELLYTLLDSEAKYRKTFFSIKTRETYNSAIVAVTKLFRIEKIMEQDCDSKVLIDKISKVLRGEDND